MMPSGGTRLLATGILLIALLGATSCSRRQPTKRIVIVTFDTLRADHLGTHGYPRPTSPFLDSLAREGVVFTDALAPMATTVPSHSSLFTGLYALQHGVQHNGQVLDDHFTTLAELARAAGLTTAASVATRHLGRGRLDQGFDTYLQHEEGEKGWMRRANKVVDAALEWADTVPRDAGFFLWIHFFDIHNPYSPPARYRKLIRQGTSKTRDELATYFYATQHISPEFMDGDRSRLLLQMDRYDGDIRFVDDELERLFESMRARGLLDHSLWILTADHGEGLGNHNWQRHGKHIYNEQLHVPLIFWSADSRWKPQRVPDLVELTDVLPTVVELADLKSPDQPIVGRSLVTLLEGNDDFPERRAFGERRTFSSPPDPDSKRAESYEAGERFSLQSKRYKYLYWTAGDDEFYDLRSDPYETTNLIGKDVPEAEEFRRDLLRRLGALKKSAYRAKNVDESGMRELEALGYVN